LVLVQAAVLSLSIWQSRGVLIEAGGDGEGDDHSSAIIQPARRRRSESEMGLLRSAVHGRVTSKAVSTLLTGGVIRALVRWADAPCII